MKCGLYLTSSLIGRSEAVESTVAEAGTGSEAAPGVQCQTAGAFGGGIQDRQVFERQQANGAVEGAQFDGGADQDVVPEPADEMEETVDDKTENGAKTGTVFAALFHGESTVLRAVCAVLRVAFGLRFRRSGGGGGEAAEYLKDGRSQGTVQIIRVYNKETSCSNFLHLFGPENIYGGMLTQLNTFRL